MSNAIDSAVDFFESTDSALYHSNMVVDPGRKFKDHSNNEYTVLSVDGDSMTAVLESNDSETLTVSWPSEGGRFRPCDTSGFTANN